MDAALESKANLNWVKQQIVDVTGAITGTSISTSSGWSISTMRRFCIAGQSGSSYTNPWYKVATVNLDINNHDSRITFLVENTYGSHASGILHIHIRTDDDKKVQFYGATEVYWLVNHGFTLSDFVLVCPTTASPTCELWTNIDQAYMFRSFTVLSEGNRYDQVNEWTLLNSHMEGQSASITTIGTQIISS